MAGGPAHTASKKRMVHELLFSSGCMPRLESIMLQNFPIMLLGISPISAYYACFLVISEMHYAFIMFFLCTGTFFM